MPRGAIKFFYPTIMQKAPNTPKPDKTGSTKNGSTHAMRYPKGGAKSTPEPVKPKVKVGRGSRGRAARVTTGVVDRGAWARDSFRDVYVGCMEFLQRNAIVPPRGEEVPR